MRALDLMTSEVKTVLVDESGRKSPRVGVFLDTANIHTRVLEAILWYARSLGRVIVLKAYLPASNLQGLYRLVQAGLQPTVVLTKGLRTSDIDSRMIVDIMDQPNLDIFVIGSGDGDFIPVAQHLVERGRRVIITCRRESVSRKLVRMCDEFLDLDELLQGYVDGKDLSR